MAFKSTVCCTKKSFTIVLILLCVAVVVFFHKTTGLRYVDLTHRSGSVAPESSSLTQKLSNKDLGNALTVSNVKQLNSATNVAVPKAVDAFEPLNDFVKYPCVPGISEFPQSGWTVTGRCVRMFNDTQKVKSMSNSTCVPLRTRKGSTPICTYDAKNDHYISKSLQTSGQWEGGLVDNIVECLLSHKDSEFLDLGCNIGTYTLAVAHHGIKATAVDAVIDNLELLSKSLTVGKLHDQATLIWNAISDGYSKVGLTKYQGNVGGTAIRSLTKDDKVITQTIKLGDLVPLFKGKRVIIKMDIETQEYNALLGGQTFFEAVDVPMIQMEINAHKTKDTGPKIIDYLAARHFKPFADSKQQKPLNASKIREWPGDVYFIKS